MTRLPERPGVDQLPDPDAAVIKTIRGTLAEKGLVLHLATDRQIVDDLFPNVVAHMWGPKYGIALLEDLSPRRR